MNCRCHGEPAYWNKDKRLKAGGFWECAVKRRQRQRDLYDEDPIYRIARRLQINRRERLINLARRQEEYRRGKEDRSRISSEL